jgi:hypothetical protein
VISGLRVGSEGLEFFGGPSGPAEYLWPGLGGGLMANFFARVLRHGVDGRCAAGAGVYEFEALGGYVESGVGTRGASGVAAEGFETTGLAEDGGQFVGEAGEVVHLDGSAVLQEEIGVAGFLSGDWVDHHHRRAACQRLGGRQAAGLGNDDVGGGHQFVHLLGEAENVAYVALGARHSLQICPQFLVATRDRDDLQGHFHIQEQTMDFLHRSEPRATGQLQHDGMVAADSMPAAAFADGLELGEAGMDGNACHGNVVAGNSPILEMNRPLRRGNEIALAGGIYPEAVGIKIGGHHGLREVDAFVEPERRNNLRGQEVSADCQIPRLFGYAVDEPLKIHHGQREPDAVDAGPSDRLVEPIVQVSDDVRGAIDKSEIAPAVHPAEGSIRVVQYIYIFDDRIRANSMQREMQCLGGPVVARSHTGSEDENSRAHEVDIFTSDSGLRGTVAVGSG